MMLFESWIIKVINEVLWIIFIYSYFISGDIIFGNIPISKTSQPGSNVH